VIKHPLYQKKFAATKPLLALDRKSKIAIKTMGFYMT
jgi:hypothetical protein